MSCIARGKTKVYIILNCINSGSYEMIEQKKFLSNILPGSSRHGTECVK